MKYWTLKLKPQVCKLAHYGDVCMSTAGSAEGSGIKPVVPDSHI